MSPSGQVQLLPRVCVHLHARRLGRSSDPYAVDLGAVLPFAPHLRITALGTLGSSDERFSYGVNCVGPVDPNGFTDAQVEAVASAVRSFHVRPATRIASVAVLRSVKLAAIGADGKYTADAVELPVTSGQGATNDGSGLVLPQSALAVSLMGVQRGASNRGRFYIPMPVIDVQPTNGFTMAVEFANGVATSAQTFLNELEDIAGLNLNVAIASTKGFMVPVTRVRVGRVIDTIRSRRNRLVELYTADLPVGP